ncbi:PHP domain-like protein [Hesseltinella vesiculosa]|uniref:PHP domain-like protein n=1 Tax=Hesseltinella vesiculosa TaxID=101127 RepID=A0A1X2GVV3_9FUNG|nr:PHP domain-like protein [Hesseltinella vesiculosa]
MDDNASVTSTSTSKQHSLTSTKKRNVHEPALPLHESTTPLWPSNNNADRRSWRFWLRLLTPSKEYLRGLFIRIITVIVILGVIIALGIGLQYTDGLPTSEDFSNLEFDWQVNPSSYLTPWNQSFQYNVLLDGHSHSNYSDGKMNVKQLLDWHIANGYNAVMVTDHNTLEGGLAAEQLALSDNYYRERIVVIPGMEYSCCRIHMNLIGINDTIPVGPPVPSDEQLQAVINQTHAMGGIVIVNHIPWSNTIETGYQLPRLPNHPSVADLIAWGVDGFEVINQGTFDWQTLQAAQAHNLIQMIGTDVHHPSVPVNAWLTVNSPAMNKSSIMNEITARRTSFLYDPTGTPQRVYPDTSSGYEQLMPLTSLGDYFGMFYSIDKGMYSFQGTFCQPQQFQIQNNVIAWFIFWLIILMVVYELVRAFVTWAAQAILHCHRRRTQNRTDASCHAS